MIDIVSFFFYFQGMGLTLCREVDKIFFVFLNERLCEKSLMNITVIEMRKLT